MFAHAAQRMYLELFLLILFPFDLIAADSTEAVASPAVRSQVMGNDSLNSGYLVQLIMGLLFVLLCIVVLAWLAKRVNRLQSSSDGSLQVLGGISMGARERVVLVQVGETQLLLGVAPGRINMLHQLEEPLERAGTGSGDRAEMPFARGFSEKLNSALARYK